MAERKTFSFGFSKKVSSNTLEKSILQNDNERFNEGKEQDFVTSLEDCEIKGSNTSKQTQKEKRYVIPLITQNKWQLPDRGSDATEKEKGISNPEKLDSQAVKELIEDAARQNEGWDDRDKMDPNLAIPLIMRNKVPEGYETDDKLDVVLRPDESSEANYEEMPIEHFGVAMLRGMGWKDGEGIGKNKKPIAPLDAQLRPKGLGLGADRSKVAQLNNTKVSGTNGTDEEELILKKGAYCLVQNGYHKDRYGVIEGIDEDNARCMVKLAVSGLVITLSQYSIKTVDKKEYTKYSKYLNKGKVDRYKEEQERSNKHDKGSHKDREDRKHKHRHKDDRKERHHHDDERKDRRNKDDERKHKRHKDDKKERQDRDVEMDMEMDRRNERLSDDRYTERKRDRDMKDQQDTSEHKKRRKHERSTSPYQTSNANGHSRSSKACLWICPQLRVRIVDKNFKKGKYFSTKVEVIDVLSPDNCVCRTDDGKVLEGLSQDMLETVIPKSDSAFVQILTGKFKGLLSQLMKKDKSNCTAVVQLLRDRDEVIKLDYDSLCEYVGDINAEFDY